MTKKGKMTKQGTSAPPNLGEDELAPNLTTLEAIDAMLDSLGDSPTLASVRQVLVGHREVVAKQEEEERRLLPFVAVADDQLGTLPEYSPDWRGNPACQAVTITTVEVDDTSAEMVEVEIANGDGGSTKEKRYPKKLARHVAIGAAIKVLESGKPPKASGSPARGIGGKLEVVVTKLENGTTLWRKRYTTGAACTRAEGLDEGKQSAPAFLSTYRIGGIRYLVDYVRDNPELASVPLES